MLSTVVGEAFVTLAKLSQGKVMLAVQYVGGIMHWLILKL